MKLQTTFDHPRYPVDKLLRDAGLVAREVPDHGLRIRVMFVGPLEAAAMLKANQDNRRLRPGRVKFYARVQLAGSWMLTHQGIAFSADGSGIDLQHRLQAVILSGVEIKLIVVEGLERSAFEAIDQHERRSMSDALKLPRDVCEVAKFFRLVAHGETQPLPRDVDEVACQIVDAHSMLAPRVVKVMSAAPMRAAAVLLQLESPESAQLIADRYRDLVLHHTERWTPTMHAFGRQVGDGKLGSTRAPVRMDLFSRGLIVLDPRRAAVGKIQIKAATHDIARARTLAALDMAHPNSDTVERRADTERGPVGREAW